MKIAFLLLVHKDPKQINVLLKQLLTVKESLIYVHISKQYFNDIYPYLLSDSRVIILNDSITVSWGSDQILRAQLLLLSRAVHDNNDFFAFLSGQDMMIKRGISEYFEKNKEKILLDASTAEKMAKTRLEYYWHPKYARLIDTKFSVTRIFRRLRIELIKRGFPFKRKVSADLAEHHRLQYYISSCWCAFPLSFAKYTINMWDDEYIRTLFSDAINPEEHYWSILAMNSQFRGNVLQGEKLVYTGVFKNSHPEVITESKIQELDSSRYFFARKFDSQKDPGVIEYYSKKITSFQ